MFSLAIRKEPAQSLPSFEKDSPEEDSTCSVLYRLARILFIFDRLGLFVVLFQVILEGVLLGERFAAATALERMYPAVDAPVHDQIADARVGFLAYFTLDPIAGMEPRVFLQCARIHERLLAGGAFVGPLRGVAPPVDD